MLPIIEILDGLETDAARARWLLRVPDTIVDRDYQSIRAVLLMAGFRVGAKCLEVRFVSLRATRTETGDLPTETKELLEAARAHLLAISREPIDTDGTLQ